MVTVHPGGAARTGPSRPRSRPSWTASARTSTTRSASWRTSRTPRRSRSSRSGLSRPDYMGTWGGYTTEPRFGWSADAPGRGARARRAAGRRARRAAPALGDEGARPDAVSASSRSWITIPPSSGAPPADFYGELLEQAEAADELGFDSFWVAEHHFHEYGAVPAPAGAAGRGRRSARAGSASARAWSCCRSTTRCASPRTTRWSTCSRAAASTSGVGSGYLTHEYAGFNARPGGEARALRRGARDPAPRVDRRALLVRGPLPSGP